MAGQGRAGQGRAGQGRAGQGRVGRPGQARPDQTRYTVMIQRCDMQSISIEQRRAYVWTHAYWDSSDLVHGGRILSEYCQPIVRADIKQSVTRLRISPENTVRSYHAQTPCHYLVPVKVGAFLR